MVNPQPSTPILLWRDKPNPWGEIQIRPIGARTSSTPWSYDHATRVESIFRNKKRPRRNGRLRLSFQLLWAQLGLHNAYGIKGVG